VRSLYVPINPARSSLKWKNTLLFAGIFAFIMVSGVASGMVTTHQLYIDVVKNFLIRIPFAGMYDAIYIKIVPVLFALSMKVLFLGLSILPAVNQFGILFSATALFLQSILYGVSLYCGLMNDFSWPSAAFCCLVLLDGVIMFSSMYFLYRHVIGYFLDNIRISKNGQVFSMNGNAYRLLWKPCVVFLFCGIIEGAIIPSVSASFWN